MGRKRSEYKVSLSCACGLCEETLFNFVCVKRKDKSSICYSKYQSGAVKLWADGPVARLCLQEISWVAKIQRFKLQTLLVLLV